MILSIYITLLILTAAFIYWGRTQSSPPSEVTGYLFLFLLGLTLMLGGVVYPNGEYTEIVDVALYNGTVVGTNTQTVANYTSYSGEVVAGMQLHHTFGFFVSMASVFLFIGFYLNMKEGL